MGDSPEVQTSSIASVAMLGSYVPRQCGIATFSKSLRDAMVESQTGLQTFVVAMDDVAAGYAYGSEVRFQLQMSRPEDYRTCAEMLNIHQIDVLSLQHEFGLFGGRSGEYLLPLLRRLRMPIITTLHTILAEPSREQATIMRELSRLSDRLVVMADRAVQMLDEIYQVPREKVAVIPHGIPDVPFTDPAFYKDQFGLDDRVILLTFGLLSPGKGIEAALQALPRIVEQHPEVMYLVVGTTHPHILRREGTAYLNSLERLADRLGVLDHVSFHHRFVTADELIRYLGAADLYLTPYLERSQITSGTLAYAMGAGKAVLSTPYWHAEEMLAEERGRFFAFGDADALATAANELLGDEVKRNAMRKRAYLFSRHMVWKEVGRRYLELARQIVEQRREHPRPVSRLRAERRRLENVPEVNMAHLRRLTDGTGMLQHAVYHVADRIHGYCTDDNARALLAAIEYYDLTQDDSILHESSIYMAFLQQAFDPAVKRFRNFMSYDRRWLEETGSEDAHGRAVWALGRLVALAPNENVLGFASRLFTQALVCTESFSAPRSCAFSLLGVHAYLERFPGDTMVRRVRQNLAERLHALFREAGKEDWPWCEDMLTYDNARLPQSLILAGCGLGEDAMRDQGLLSLEWLVNLQVNERGVVSLIGNHGWFSRDGHRATFDQQPVDAHAMVEACVTAYRCTNQSIWRDRAHAFLAWFLGNNDTRSVLYDYSTGGCRDGVQPDGPNLNQGAESTLAWLLSLICIRKLDIGTDVYLGAETNGNRTPVPAGR